MNNNQNWNRMNTKEHWNAISIIEIIRFFCSFSKKENQKKQNKNAIGGQ